MEHVTELATQLTNAVQKAQKALQSEREAFDSERTVWEQTVKKMNQTAVGNRITLDIGGTKFATSKNTLLAFPNSYLAVMFSGVRDIKAEEDGSFFIDRDPYVFRHILNFMRGHNFNLDRLTSQECEALEEDAEFYQVQPLIELLKKHLTRYPTISSFTWKGKPTLDETNQKISSAAWCIGHLPFIENSTQTLKLKIERHQGHGHVRVGLMSHLCTSEYIGADTESLCVYPGGTMEGYESHKTQALLSSGDIIELALNMNSKTFTIKSNADKVISTTVPADRSWALAVCTHCAGDEISLLCK
jgi:hypothetical protein